MHGRVKTRSTEEEKELKRKERQKKVSLYRAGISKAFEKWHNKEFDEEALFVTEELLANNPDIYSLWNFRREIFLSLKNSSTELDLEKSITKELRLTEVCLKVNPKSYCTWHHRCWILDNIAPDPNWTQELAVCTKYLELDERNFHVWDYRKFIVQRANVSAKSELDYTTSKIEKNFSNYSSWHYRSQYLPLVHPDPTGNRPIDKDVHMEELTMVESAAFTDPNDQSGWFYQRWLLDLQQQLPVVLTQVCVDSKLTWVVFNKPLDPTDCSFVINGVGPGEWKTCDSESASHIWVKATEDSSLINPNEAKVSLLINKELVNTLELKFITENDKSCRMVGYQKPAFVNKLNPEQGDFYTSLLKSVTELLEIEPDSKWPLLSYVTIARHLKFQSSREEIYEKLKLLKEVDPMRKNYYNDLRSKYLIEDKLTNVEDFTSSFEMSGLNLTALYHTHYLSLFREINFSENNLGVISRPYLSSLQYLQACQVLNIKNNQLGDATLSKLPNLLELNADPGLIIE